MAKPTLYLENSFVGYLTSEPSRDIVTAARQELSRQWWSEHRADYELYVSQFVISEARACDSEASARRLNVLKGIPEVELTEAAAESIS